MRNGVLYMTKDNSFPQPVVFWHKPRNSLFCCGNQPSCRI